MSLMCISHVTHNKFILWVIHQRNDSTRLVHYALGTEGPFVNSFVTHSWRIRDSFVTHSWLIRDSFVTHSWLIRDSFIMLSLRKGPSKTHSSWHTSWVMLSLRMSRVTHILTSEWVRERVTSHMMQYVWHDSFICVWHDSFVTRA